MGGGVIGINPSEANVADICLYDKRQDKLIIVDGNEFDGSLYPSTNYSPVGVVVVPGHHNVYGDGSCAVISLKYMSCGTPDIGILSAETICYGQNTTDLKALHNYDEVGIVGVGSNDVINETIQDLSSNGYLPSDQSSFIAIDNPYDTKTKYYTSEYNENFLPSPYKNDGSFNSEYSKTDSPSSPNNALSDFDGIGNTKILCEAATAQPNWKEDLTLTNDRNNGYSPAACCCWRYHTDGTNQGDWYLPACGELGYMMVRMRMINTSMIYIRRAYGASASTNIESKSHWSSTEYSSSYARFINTNTGILNNRTSGNFSNRKLKSYAIRAFLRVKSK